MTRPHLRSIKSQVKKLQQVVAPEEIFAAYREAGLGRLQCNFYDAEFVALPMSVWQDFLAWSRLSEVEYIAERRDCDNFALMLTAEINRRLHINGCGLVFDISGCHCYNCLLVKEETGPLQIALIEPQTDQLIKIGYELSKSEAYKAEKGFVTFL